MVPIFMGMSLLKLKDSSFVFSLLAVELVAFCPFIVEAFEGRAVIFWSHYGVRPYFF